jgi:hypothetical protein
MRRPLAAIRLEMTRHRRMPVTRGIDLMYSLPHQTKLRECVITREIVETNDMLRSWLEKAG